MTRLAALRRLDPVDLASVEAVTSGAPFDELCRSILEGSTRGAPADAATQVRPRRRSRRSRVGAGLAAAALLVIGLVVAIAGGGGRLTHPITTGWQPGRPVPPAATPSGSPAGTWRLVDEVTSGRWQQDTSGPPPGSLACPSATTCYTMSGRYSSSMAGAPLLGESLYVSTDLGATWSRLAMPGGFAPTSPLACADASTCAAGGTYHGQAVLVVTHDAGHSFTVDPLPPGVGTFYALSCPTAGFCAGLAATKADGNGTPIDATLLSTDDGGATFTDTPIVSGDSMLLISCAGTLDCTVVGTAGTDGSATGVAAVTTDGGATWTASALPAGFTISYVSQLSCADATHCSVTGLVAAHAANPSPCTNFEVPRRSPTASAVPGPAVRALCRVVRSSGTSGPTFVSDVATTSDGGTDWTPDPMPADVPQPSLSGLACPTDDECWASGEDAVPEQVGTTLNGGSPVLLGTTDGGRTWSKVTFSVPEGAPDYEGQSYLSVGPISCATGTVCAAVGAAAQGARTAPFYSLEISAAG